MSSSTSMTSGEATSTCRIGEAEPCWFGNAERTLFGWLHHPSGVVRAGGVLLCEPIGYDALLTHSAYRRMAESFAAAGVMTLRFNYWGTGDSAGSDQDGADFDGWLASVDAARRELERACRGGPITLLGVRMGATLAALSGAARPAEHAVLWHPVGNGRAYVRELHALAALTSGATMGAESGELEAGGFHFPEALQSALSAVTPQAVTRAPAPRVLLVYRDDMPPSTRLAERLRELGSIVEETAVAGYAEMMRDPHESLVPTAAIEVIWAHLADVHPVVDYRVDSVAVPASVQHLACTDPTGSVALTEAARCFAAAVPLFGIETRRLDADDRARTIVLLNAGALHHIGPNRLYVTLAREWAALGYRVLRMDVSGTGDSDVLPTSSASDPYSGAHPDDVQRVVAMLRAETPTMHVTLTGLCSGAYLAFTAARLGTPVERIVLINPLTFYWHDGDTPQNPAVTHFRNVSYYWSAMTSRKRWRRVLTGRSDLRAAVHTTTSEVSRRLKATYCRLAFSSANGGDDLRGDLLRMASGGVRMHVVFSAGDPGRRMLEASASGVVALLVRQSKLTQTVIRDADHIFSRISARADLRRQLARLMKQP